MIGSLRENWRHTWKAIWSRLDESTKSPDDLFVRLYRAARRYLADPPDALDEISISNDRDVAKAFFRALTGESFNGERAIIAFLEDTYQDLAFLEDGCAAFFDAKCRDFLTTFNLPYCICGDFEIRLLPVGPMASLYHELRLLNDQDPHLASRMDDFERAFHRYASTHQEADLRVALGRFSNYLEALTQRTLNVQGTNQGLGSLARSVTSWPHKTLCDAVGKLYGFCSDYPGIRHTGNPAAKLRDLKELDAVSLCCLFVGFGGYLTEDIRESELIEA